MRLFEVCHATAHAHFSFSLHYSRTLSASVADTIITDDEGNESTRSLGLVVVRGTLLVLVSPVDGSEEIANPFVQPEDD